MKSKARNSNRHSKIIAIFFVGLISLLPRVAQAKNECSVTFVDSRGKARTFFSSDFVEEYHQGNGPLHRDIMLRIRAVGGPNLGEYVFVDRTTGPCHVELFSGLDYQGEMATVGSALASRIRAGVNGLTEASRGGAGTWAIKSARFVPFFGRFGNQQCRLSMGGTYTIYQERIQQLGFSKESQLVPAGSVNVAMTYFGAAERTPGLHYVIAFEDTYPADCRARLYNDDWYNDYGSDPQNVYADIKPSVPRSPWYPVKTAQNDWEGLGGVYEAVVDSSVVWRTRSLRVWDTGDHCSAEFRDRSQGVTGRCVPRIQLCKSIFDTVGNCLPVEPQQPGSPVPVGGEGQGNVAPGNNVPGVGNVPPIAVGEVFDADRDGLHDVLENQLAEAFRPYFVNHSTEDATRHAAYQTAGGEWVSEPVTIFQVERARVEVNGIEQIDRTKIVIRYMKLWLDDVYDTAFCGGHAGDSQKNSITISTPSNFGSPDFGRDWTLVAMTGGTKGELGWDIGDRVLRTVMFDRAEGEGIAMHPVIYFTKGKHHEYSDTGFSNRTDKHCANINAYINAHGDENCEESPDGREMLCLGKRLAELRAPVGMGDRHGYNNVGNRANQYPNMNSLEAWGFPTAELMREVLYNVPAPAGFGTQPEQTKVRYEQFTWGPPCVWGDGTNNPWGCDAFFYSKTETKGAGSGFQ